MIANGYKPKLTALGRRVLGPTPGEFRRIQEDVLHRADILNTTCGIPQLGRIDDPEAVIAMYLDNLIMDKLQYVATRMPWYGRDYEAVGLRWQRINRKNPGWRYAKIALTYCPEFQIKKDANLEEGLRILNQFDPPYAMDRLIILFG